MVVSYTDDLPEFIRANRHHTDCRHGIAPVIGNCRIILSAYNKYRLKCLQQIRIRIMSTVFLWFAICSISFHFITPVVTSLTSPPICLRKSPSPLLASEHLCELCSST